MTGTPIFSEKCVSPAFADMDRQNAPQPRHTPSIRVKIFLHSILTTFYTVIVAVFNLNRSQTANPDTDCKRCNFVLPYHTDFPEKRYPSNAHAAIIICVMDKLSS